MGLADRLRRRPRHDEASIRALLTDAGATSDEAQRIVGLLGRRLAPDEMHDWLAHPQRAHPVPDPESEATFGVVLDWTAINAVGAGKTHLVLDEAARFAEG